MEGADPVITQLWVVPTINDTWSPIHFAIIGLVVDLSYSSQQEPASFLILPVRNRPAQYLIDGKLLSASTRVAVAVVGAPEVLIQILLTSHIIC